MPALYWKNQAADGLWANESNWFTNAAGTIQASFGSFGSGVPRCPWVGGYYPNYDIYLATGETGTPAINLQMETSTMPLTLDGGSGTCFIPSLSLEAVYVGGGSFYSNIVTNADTSIIGGHFLGDFTNYSNIFGGTFNGTVFNGFYIYGGTFSGANFLNNGAGSINGGTFSGSGFTNLGYASAGTFSGVGMVNNGTISGTISCPSFGGDGNYELCTFSGPAIPHMVRNGIQLNSSVGSIIISNDQASLMDVLSTGFL